MVRWKRVEHFFMCFRKLLSASSDVLGGYEHGERLLFICTSVPLKSCQDSLKYLSILGNILHVCEL